VKEDSWEARMAERAKVRAAANGDKSALTMDERIEADRARRAQWPVPAELRGYSARDVLLWYICDGWRKIFGEDEPVETLFYGDFGYHVLRKGSWQLTLTNLEWFPHLRYPEPEGPEPD
jgi:hypothetical protein